MDRSLVELESIVRNRICNVCTERTVEGQCGLEEPSSCALFRLLPQVAQAIQSVKSDDIQEYLDAIRANVCSVCVDRAADGSCETRQEVRCAVRFPLTLPVLISSRGKGEIAAVTRNVSASGVLFEVDRPLKVGLEIRFSLRMPGTVLGTPRDVLVHCLGRVVRCSLSQTQYLAAATIDEYQFAEQ